MTTNTTFFTHDSPKTVREVLDFLNDELEVDEMMISPAYAYEKAPDQEHFLGVAQTRELFSEAFADGRRKRWRLNHSPLFLDFLEGKVDFECTAWGIPSYSLFGWQRPCYLMADGYTETYKELLETTDWDKYGRGKRPALRQLHGPLRLRADGRAADDPLAAPVAARARRLELDQRLPRAIAAADVLPAQALAEQRRDAQDQRGDDLDGLQDDPVGERLARRRRRRRPARPGRRPGRRRRSTGSPAGRR